MRVVFISAIFLLTGCAAIHKIDRDVLTQFEMEADDTWRMTARTAANYPVESEKAEGIRMQWLDDHLRANGCRDHEVTERVWTKAPTDNFINTGFSKNVGVLVYHGTCIR